METPKLSSQSRLEYTMDPSHALNNPALLRNASLGAMSRGKKTHYGRYKRPITSNQRGLSAGGNLKGNLKGAML